MKKLLFFIMLMAPLFAHANKQEIFLRANKSYHDGDFQQALVIYESIEKKGRAVWYNMGNCYYELADYSRALVCWKRAQRGAPRKESVEIEGNMRRALKKLGKPTDERFVTRTYNLVTRSTEFGSLFFFQILFFIFWYSLFLVGLIRRFGFARFAVKSVGSLCVAILGVVVIVKTMEYGSFQAIVVEQTPLFVGPNERYQRIATLTHADRVVIAERAHEWCKVRTHDAVGWIPEKALEVI